MAIHYVSHTRIDPERWNDCIRQSPQGLVYAEWDYLRHLAPGWDALVEGDYAAVMPLFLRKKWGIRYSYHPAFVQQGGVFARNGLTYELANRFLKELSRIVRYIDTPLNFGHSFPLPLPEMTSRSCTNYIRRLQPGTPLLSRYLEERLKRSRKFNLVYRPATHLSDSIRRFREHNLLRMNRPDPDTFDRLEACLIAYEKQGRVIHREVVSEGLETVLARVVLLTDSRRMYLLVSCLEEAGKQKLANYFLLDALFREWGNSGLLFDFEGSDLPGVGYFYEKWADANQPFFHLHYNNLPIPLRWLKR